MIIDILNYEKVLGSTFFSDEDEGIECNCLPECDHIQYDIELAPIILT